MEKIDELFPDHYSNCGMPNPKSKENPRIHITDKRVAQLLLVLHELDESVAGLEELPKTDLSELISNAILACGFVDPTEARYAIAAVLETIETPEFMSESPSLD